MVFWRPSPDHSLSSVCREIAEYPNCQVTVVCVEDIRPRRKKLGWRLPDFGKAALHLLPERGWTEQVDGIIRNNQDSIHILLPSFKNAKMRYALLNIINKGRHYGLMSEIPVNQYVGLRWLPREIYLQSVMKPSLFYLLRKSLFMLSIGKEINVFNYFRKLVRSVDQIFPFGYFPEAPASLPEGEERLERIDEAVVELVYLGMLIPRKGVDLLIKALSRLKKAGLKYRCHIVGDGPYRQELENISQTLGLQDVVRFRGPVAYAEVRSLLKRCDILVAPGKLEPWGMPVNEAIQSGLAVVVSDKIGGGSDLVRVSGAGKVFSSGNIESLAENLRKLIVDPLALVKAKERAEKFKCNISPKVAAEYLLNVVLYSTGKISERPYPSWLKKVNFITDV
jgi:glycosyltransferase involved in cell wall biosynthesis